MVSIKKIALLSIFMSNLTAAHELASEYKVLADKWTESIIGVSGQEYDNYQLGMINKVNQDALKYLNSLIVIDARSSLWSDLPFDYANGGKTIGPNIRSSMLRLLTMAKAYRFPGELQGNSILLSSIISSLDYLVKEHYKVGALEYGNWWDWEIGIPKTLNDILTVIYPDLTSEQIKNYTEASRYFSPLPDRNGVSEGASASSNPVNREATGGNRTDMVQIVLVRGIISEREDEIKNSLGVLPQVLDPVTTDDGFYHDGSFIQHGDIPYTGTYGNVLLEGVGKVMNLMANSKWPADDPKLLRVYNILYKSFFPFMYSGQMLDMQNGRAIARGERQNHVEGHAILASMFRFIDAATINDRNKISEFIKGQIISDNTKDFLQGQQDFVIYNKAKKLIEDTSIHPVVQSPQASYFPDMDRFVYQGRGYTFSLALHSARVGNFECMNNENRRGWFTGDGATYLYNADLLQYTDYWPLINPYRVSGTTIDLTESLGDCTNNNKVASRVGKNKQVNMQRVGGAAYNTSAAIGADFHNHNDSISALKSWFVVNNKVIAVGSDILSNEDVEIGTIIDSRKLNANGTNKIEVNGVSITPDIKDVYSNVNSFLVEGNVKGANVGYWFPKGTDIVMEKKLVSANWSDIGTTKKVVNGYTLASFIPQDEHVSGYQYVILNGINSHELNEYANNPDIIVTRSDNKAHIVEDTNGENILANLWGNDEVSVGSIKISSPVSIILNDDVDTLTLSLSDPTRSLTQVALKTDGNFNIKSDPEGRISVKGDTVVINLESLNGTTYHFSLERDDSASVDSHRSDDNSGGGAVDVLAMFFLGILGLRRMH
ncbi:polysaccharide lyase 8 family protein [Aeromonas allosaccharophila]|uniref:polysaccharide lyase 8 family protein n=2 Tax=Aeromonas allosaccharophila TaxID=656 RepID=UPI001BCFDEF8|nr:polysaccharide lyase 8 family protein [Aeromonas allosaccharophila]MBS4694211.1 polysaccharide lyase 8 family protein [Aeromonas allosaccharophila]